MGKGKKNENHKERTGATCTVDTPQEGPRHGPRPTLYCLQSLKIQPEPCQLLTLPAQTNQCRRSNTLAAWTCLHPCSCVVSTHRKEFMMTLPDLAPPSLCKVKPHTKDQVPAHREVAMAWLRVHMSIENHLQVWPLAPSPRGRAQDWLGRSHLGPVVAGSIGKYVSVVIEAAGCYGLV